MRGRLPLTQGVSPLIREIIPRKSITLLTFVSGLIFSWFVPAVTAQEDADDKGQVIHRLLKEGVANLDAGQYQASLAALDSLLAVDAGNADGHFYRGLALLHAGDSADALEALVDGSQAAPMSSRIKLLLARLQISKDDVDAAEVQINSVLMIKPKQGEALYLKGLVLLARGDASGAVVAFEQSLEGALSPGGSR